MHIRRMPGFHFRSRHSRPSDERHDPEDLRRKKYDYIPMFHPYILPSYAIGVVGIVMVIIGAFFQIHALLIGILFVPLTCVYCNVIRRCRGEELIRYNMERHAARSGNTVESSQSAEDNDGSSTTITGLSVNSPGTVNIAFAGDPEAVTRVGDQILLGKFPSPPPYTKDVPKYFQIQEIGRESEGGGVLSDQAPAYSAETGHIFRIEEQSNFVNNRTTQTSGMAPWSGETLDDCDLPPVYTDRPLSPPPSYLESTRPTQVQQNTRY